jgi:ribosomal protein L7/L12
MDEKSLNDHIFRISQAVARLERKTDFILKELKLNYVDDPNSNVPPELAQVYALVRAGKKLEAIQAYRKQTGMDLNSAKLFIEQIEVGSV